MWGKPSLFIRNTYRAGLQMLRMEKHLSSWKTKQSKEEKAEKSRFLNYSCRQLIYLWRNLNIKILHYNPCLLFDHLSIVCLLIPCSHFLCSSWWLSSSNSLILSSWASFLLLLTARYFLILILFYFNLNLDLESWFGTLHVSLISMNLLRHILQLHCLVSLSANLSEISCFLVIDFFHLVMILFSSLFAKL